MIVSEAVRETLRLAGAKSASRNRLSEAALAADESLVFEFDLGGIAAGATLETPVGEQIYVWSVDTATKTATVSRGQNGTTAADLAVGDVLLVSPRLFRSEVKGRLAEELDALEAEGLFQRKTLAITYDYTNEAFDISSATDLLSPYAIEWNNGGRREFIYSWLQLDDNYLRPYLVPPVTSATLHYRAKFTAFTQDSDDLESVCGLPTSAHDILPLGAAAKLLFGREGVRVDERVKQYGRSDEGVPPTSISTLARQLMAQRDLRVAAELARAHRHWPLRTP